MSPIYAGVAAFFSVSAFVFYIIAANGNSNDHQVLKGCQWMYYYQNDYTVTNDYYYNYNYNSTTTFYYNDNNNINDIKVYYGLKGYYLILNVDIMINQFYYYSDDVSINHTDYSSKCDKSGKITIILIIIACIFSFLSIITNGVYVNKEEIFIKAISAILSMLACLLGTIAVSIFMTSCYHKIYNSLDNNDMVNTSTHNLHYGNGFILSLSALLCNFISFKLIIINIITNNSSNFSNNNSIQPDIQPLTVIPVISYLNK